MKEYQLTNRQARRFMLLKQGLMGDYRFVGKQGVLDFVRQAGCAQYDPIDVCGKNAELVLQSRVKGFTKQMFYQLLYEDRALLDHLDKNLAIIETADWPYFWRRREVHRTGDRSQKEIGEISEQIKDIIREKGCVCSADLGFDHKVSWYWGDTKLSRAALEALYYQGDLAIHHKKGTIKYYDLVENCLDAALLTAPKPHLNLSDHYKWWVLRRISAVGLLWNKPSDAWLGMKGFVMPHRKDAFEQLLAEDRLLEITVEGIKGKLYCLASDRDLLEKILQEEKLKPRCELIAPLDSMLWDRKLIKALFDFDYKWEIYTPEEQRKFGYYVLPLLYGDRLIGRVEAVCVRKAKALLVKNIWYEAGVKPSKTLTKALGDCIKRFAAFHGCKEIVGM